MKECDFITNVGIVAEFNPLHNGHAHLLSIARQMGAECVVCSLSGNFVQRGDTALISKHARAETALKCGVDLCLELPVVYSMSTAQNFALGSVFALASAGVDTIMFGSECGNTEMLKTVAKLLETEEFSAALSKHLESGCSFPAARRNAVAQIAGEAAANVLDNPNDTLGVEYIMSAQKFDPNIEFFAVKRIGAAHDSTAADSICPSASFIRQLVKENRLSEAEKFMPKAAFDILCREAQLGRISDIYRLETAILARLRSIYDSEIHRLPDLSEGIENRLVKASLEATSLDELYSMIKTKRYSHARIRRLVLSAFLRIESDYFLTPPPYVRILGHTEAGRRLLKTAFKNIPAFSRSSEFNDPSIGKRAVRMFEIERTATDLFELSLEKPGKCYGEFTNKLITL